MYRRMMTPTFCEKLRLFALALVISLTLHAAAAHGGGGPEQKAIDITVVTDDGGSGRWNFYAAAVAATAGLAGATLAYRRRR